MTWIGTYIYDPDDPSKITPVDTMTWARFFEARPLRALQQTWVWTEPLSEGPMTDAICVCPMGHRLLVGDQPRPILVSTIFLGLDHNFARVLDRLYGDATYKPILWESMIFWEEYGPRVGAAEDEQEQWRYRSYEEAMREHWRLVAGVVLRLLGIDPTEANLDKVGVLDGNHRIDTLPPIQVVAPGAP